MPRTDGIWIICVVVSESDRMLVRAQEERAAGNPVASLIRSLALERNRITLALPDWLEEGLQDEEADGADSADEDGVSAHAVARSALPCCLRCCCCSPRLPLLLQHRHGALN